MSSSRLLPMLVAGMAASACAGLRTGGSGIVLAPAMAVVVGNVWSERMAAQKLAMEQVAEGTGVRVTQTGDQRLKLEFAPQEPNLPPILERLATTLNQNPGATVTINGNDAIATFLAAHGVAPARITTSNAAGRNVEIFVAEPRPPQG